MGGAISALFGDKPDKPKMIQQSKPVQQITQEKAESDAIKKRFAKLRRATLLNATLSEPRIRQQRLGAG